MRKFYPAFLLASLLVAFPGTSGRAQVLLEQDFEGTNTLPFTTDPAPYTVGDDVWNVVASVGSISPSATGGTMFWGGRDLDNPNGGNPDKHTLTFAANQICSVTTPTFTFEYHVDGYDSGDDFGYTLVLDGVAEPDVVLIDGGTGGVSSIGWQTATVTVPEGTINAQLIIFAEQNGGSDYFGVDNVAFSGGGTQGGCGSVCGITNFGPALVTCLTESTDPSVDEFVFEILYLGSDDDVTLLVEAGATTAASDVTATTTIGGDDPTTQSDGVVTFTSTAGAFVEGDEVRITLSDGDNCNFVVSINTTENQCSNPCGISLDPADIRFYCEGFTTGNDGVAASLPFTGGPEPGFTVTATNGATISGGDPATASAGVVVLANVVEGGFYQATFGGGGCATQTFPLVVPTNLCNEPAIVINEVLADPSVPGDADNLANDVNNDGSADSGDEFVELYNVTDAPVDMSGYTLEDDAGVFYTFPVGTTLPARTGYLVVAVPSGVTTGCGINSSDIRSGFIGLNNAGDLVALRRPDGALEHNMSYGAEGGNGESLALVPDGELTGGYVPHTSIANPTGAPLRSSPCLENDDPQFTLPVELLSFTATAGPKTVTLNWATANEVANDRFVVERSRNAARWEQIGTVRATGRSGADYTFTDELPLDGRSYYRLRQIDLDGSFVLYDPVTVQFTAASLSVYPNPATAELRFNRQLAGATISLLGSTGRTLRDVTVTNGRLDVSTLRPGIYLVRVEQDGSVETVRFVKQ